MDKPIFTNRIYAPTEMHDFLYSVRGMFRIVRKRQYRYFNVPCAFDIEASSFMENGEKRACMYVWTLCVYGAVMLGRTWDEFVEVMHYLHTELDLSPEDKRLIIYVHNLSYDFQFFRKWLEWEHVFAIDTRRPLYALTTTGIEFRCSYLLSALSLQKVGENLRVLHVRKLVGDLDYDLIRHSNTPLKPKEIAYACNDVKVVTAYIWECIEQEGNIGKIPLTNTGYVRNYCREQCFAGMPTAKENKNKRMKYRDEIKHMTLDETTYNLAHRAFTGGFTHCNPWYSGEILQDVTSFDFTSSYPTVMVAELYPMGSPEKIDLQSLTPDAFEKLLKTHCVICEIELFDVEPTITFENYLSISKCRQLKDYKSNNGRLVSASHLVTTVTDIDYQLITYAYKWSKIRIFNAYKIVKGYLPTDFVKAIVGLYKAKTELKGVEGKEAEYMRAKSMLNSCYGMSVTNIVRDPITYIDNLWDGEGARAEEEAPQLDVATILDEYNNNKSRFLFYVWGIYVTAYARRNLWLGIREFGNDYVYSDTDSVKVLHAENHMDFIRQYNEMITKRLEAACEYHHIPADDIRPKNIKGKECPLGVWDFDGHYRLFKSLGAKRYLVMYSNDPRNSHPYTIALTVAGLGKTSGRDYLIKTYGKYGSFKAFDENLYIPPEFTGKRTHTYIDDEVTGTIKDYLGTEVSYHEKSMIHLAPVDYYLSISEEYRTYLNHLWDYDY